MTTKPALNIPTIRLVNDHALTAYAIPYLTAVKWSVIHSGQEDREKTIFSVVQQTPICIFEEPDIAITSAARMALRLIEKGQ